jgi:hypothetical protein
MGHDVAEAGAAKTKFLAGVPFVACVLAVQRCGFLQAHGTARATAWESRSSPGIISRNGLALAGPFSFLRDAKFENRKWKIETGSSSILTPVSCPSHS